MTPPRKTEKTGVCILVGAGDFAPDAFEVLEGDFVVACDGGAAHLRAVGVTPDLYVGDFDSLEGGAPSGENVVSLPREKDDTDLYYAASLCLERGYRSFLLYGALGGERLSHTLGNLSLLLRLQKAGAKALLVGKKVLVGLLAPGDSRVFEPRRGYVSFFAACDGCRLSLSGFKYDFDGIADRTKTVTVSNEFKEIPARASAENGPVFFVIEGEPGDVRALTGA